MTFSAIIGQQDVKMRLLSLLSNDQLPHALLLHGNAGVGKLSLAFAIARYLMCSNPTDSDSCGHCSSCLKMDKIIHPDAHFFYPVYKKNNKGELSKEYLAQWREIHQNHHYISLAQWLNYIDAENAQGIIYSKEADEIIKTVNLKAYESRNKVLIIWYPERMHSSCANRLLKIIEEPPANSYFILVSDHPDQILGTILSRCQQIFVPVLEQADIQRALIDIEQTDPEQAHHIARLSQGSYHKALQAIELNEENRRFLTLFKHILKLAWECNIVGIRKFSNDFQTLGREAQKRFFSYCGAMIREHFIRNLHVDSLCFLSTEEDAFAQSFSPYIHEQNIIRLMEEFALAQTHIEANVNGRLVTFDLCLKLITLIKA